MPRRDLTPDDARAAIRRASTISESPPVPTIFRGRKQRYLEARVMLSTVTEAAKATGYNRSGAYRMEKDPAFKAALDQIIAERMADAQAEVKGLLPLAVRRLGDILADPRAKDSDVISAARELLDRGGIVKGGISDAAPSSDGSGADDKLERLERRARLSGLLE